MTYQDALAYLDRLLEPRPTPTPYAHVKLERMEHLCALLGNPERTFPAVLVAGTKGKGSTAAMIAAIGQAAGSRIGLYTKPHLVDVRERLRIDGTLIAPEAFAALVGEIRTAIERGASGPGWPPTYFEVTAALAFLHFAREGVDLGVVEVGIGGRLDACNVVEPSVSVITTIGYDHTEIVGTRLAQIASEDVGIMRPSGRVVTVPQREAAAAVIRQAATAHGADLIRVGHDVRYRTLETSAAGTRFTVRGRLKTYRDLSVPLLGRHQALNAAAAIAACEALAGADPRFVLSEAAVRTGLSTLHWPARIEVIRDRPTVIVDVAHNTVSFQALRAVLDETFGRRRLTLVLGVVENKDLAGIARIIAPRAAAVIATRPHHARPAPPEAVAAAVHPWVPAVKIIEDPVDAIEHALAHAGPEDVICATGSFHVAGPIRAHLVGCEPDAGRTEAGARTA
ncbi:MAG: bifunctional folylpolyglutamate synthase/dihydrofolate synthase [Armatimonadota bacterium]